MAIDGKASSSRIEVKLSDAEMVYHLRGNLDCARRDNELLSLQITDLEKEVNELRLVHINQDKLKTHNGKSGLHFIKENYQEMFNNLKEQGFDYNILNK